MFGTAPPSSCLPLSARPLLKRKDSSKHRHQLSLLPIALVPFQNFIRRRHVLRAVLALVMLGLIGAWLLVQVEDAGVGRTDGARMKMGTRGAMGSEALARSFRKQEVRRANTYQSISGRPLKTITTLHATPFTWLSPAQELSTLLHYLLISPLNTVPSYASPSEPLQPDFILDTALPSAPVARDAALRELARENRASWPVIMVGRPNEGLRKAREVFKDEKLLGKAAVGLGVIEVNDRLDAQLILDHLHRLTSSSALPLIFIGGVFTGSLPELHALDEADLLSDRLAAAGATLGADLGMRLEIERLKAEAETRA